MCFLKGERIDPIPKKAYRARRGQYNSTKLLSILAHKQYDRALYVLEDDIFPRGMKYAIGEAQIGGKVAVISTYRLKTTDEKLFLDRCVKEALHETGHILSLRHCKDPLCVMFFSKNVSITDKKTRELCLSCQDKLDSLTS